MKKIVTEPFDRKRLPPRQNLLVMPFLWLWCWAAARSGKLKIHKVGMKGLKPPYLVLGTHHSFMDFYVTPLALFPYRANYVSELEGFEAFGEWKYRQVGCLGTRKFVTDLALVQNIKRIMDRKGILVLYPEARYANAGTSSRLPLSVAKLCRHLKVPVVTINMKGNYLQSPIWNLRKRKGVKLDATITQLFTPGQLLESSVEDIHLALQKALSYDEYRWQEEAGIKISDAWRAQGLHFPLYQCPVCRKEFCMDSKGISLQCGSCGSCWTLGDDGWLYPSSPGEPVRIPDWYEWERQQVMDEISQGKYELHAEVEIQSLPNAVNFIDLGKGILHQDVSGFSLTFTDYGEAAPSTLFFPASGCFSVHTEYDYRKKGQCITLSILDNTYFLFPLSEGFNVTKIQFATEALWALSQQDLALKRSK